MSESTSQSTSTTEDAQTVQASDQEVTEAVEALVRSVTEEDNKDMSASKTAPKTKKAAAKRSVAPRSAAVTNKAQAQTVETLVGTVNSLSDSVSSLASTVEVLSDKVNAAPLSIADVANRIDETEEEEKVTINTVALGYLATLATFSGVALVAVAAMANRLDAGTIAAAVGGGLLYTLASLYMKRSHLNGGITGIAIEAGGAISRIVGLGLFIGGIQFFTENPERAARLIPIGIVAFAVGYIATSGFKLAKEHLVWVAGAAVWICLLMTFGLGKVAATFSEEPATPEVTPAAAHGEPAATEGEHGAAAPAESDHATAETPATEAGHETAPADNHESTEVPAAEGEHGAATPAESDHATSDASAEDHSAAANDHSATAEDESHAAETKPAVKASEDHAEEAPAASSGAHH